MVNPTIITKRLGAVDELSQNNVARQDLMELLGGVFDMERLMTRIVYGLSLIHISSRAAAGC